MRGGIAKRQQRMEKKRREHAEKHPIVGPPNVIRGDNIGNALSGDGLVAGALAMVASMMHRRRR